MQVSKITSDSAEIRWSLSDFATGQIEYGLTTDYGTFSEKEPSFNFKVHIQKLSNLQAGKTYNFRVISINSSGQKVMSANKTFTTMAASNPDPEPMEPMDSTPEPPNPETPSSSSSELVPFGNHRFDSEEFLRLKGMGTVIMDSLMNNKIGRTGSTDDLVSHRFRAREAGHVSEIQLYWIASTSPGYAKGNGGIIRVRIYPDDGTANHFPNLKAAHLASGEHVPKLSNGDFTSATSFYTPVKMTSTQPLVKGQLYHVVYENIDSNPVDNWICTDDNTVVTGNGDLAPWLAPSEWAVLIGKGSSGTSGSVSWQDHTANLYGKFRQTPNLQITLSNGKAFGNLRTEGANTNQPRILFSTSSTPARSRIVPDSDWVQSTANYTTQVIMAGETAGVMQWYHVKYSSPITLKAGQTYYQRYTPQNGATVAMANIRDFRDYPGYKSLDSTHSFTAQHLYNVKWLDFYDHAHATSHNGSAWRDVLHLSKVPQ